MPNLKMDNSNREDSISTVPLGELCEKLRGVSYAKEEASLVPSMDYLPILRANNIADSELVYDNLVYVPKSRVTTKQLLKKGDVVIAMSSGSKKLVGKAAQIKNDWNGSTGAFCGILRPDLNRVNIDYFGYFFSTASYRNYISDVSAGTNINNLKNEHFENILFPLPPVGEQKLIVDKLSKLLPEVKLNKNRLNKTKILIKKFRQSILTAAVTGKLTEEWRENNKDIKSAKELLEAINKLSNKKINKPQAAEINIELLPEIPTTWEWVRFEQIGELARGKSKHRPRNDPKLFGGNYPFIQTGDVARSNGKVSTYSQTYNDIGLAQSRLFPKGTLCITIAANIADSGILQFDACFPDSVVGFIPYSPIPMADYFDYFVNTAKQNLEQFAPGTAQKNINLGILNELAVPLPPLEELQEIVKKVNYYLGLVSQVEKQIEMAEAKVSKLTQAILAKTFKND